jgi:pyruvate kinase
MPIDSRPPWAALRAAVEGLRTNVLSYEQRAAGLLSSVHPAQRRSAVNLVHYMALRQHDLWALQGELATWGLFSLGRSESHVLATLGAVLHLLDALTRHASERSAPECGLTHKEGQALLQEHADGLLGPVPSHRRVRIMVTLSDEHTDPARVLSLLRSGMDCARINAAHDDLTIWQTLARNVREGARSLALSCKIAVDLPGPKCRTGLLKPGPQILKIRPHRGPSGEVIEPARVWLTTSDEHGHLPHLHVDAAFLASLEAGDVVRLRGARGKLRHLHVASVAHGAVECLSNKTAYIEHGAILHGPHAKSEVGRLTPIQLPLLLAAGDSLLLTRSAAPGRPARTAKDGSVAAPARIPCEPPELVGMVRAGESIWFDDGRIGGVVVSTDADASLVRITVAREGGEKLRSGKGINLPESELTFAAFGTCDAAALAFAAAEADIVSVSFIRDPADVHALQERLTALARPDLGIILKVETRAGFERLPELLLAALRYPTAGVMIARGDLAVECGFDRLAEIQEEILWLCEAAHVPVVWATQVLETLAKDGRPTRAEVTDAAAAERAEGVMLNKGPFVAEAVALLDDILRRMGTHQDKKSAMFRPLAVAQRFALQLESVESSATPA